MAAECIEREGVRCVQLFDQGPLLSRGSDAMEWISFASSCDAKVLVIPRKRLSDDFFELRSGLAGELLQKFVTYGLPVAILGDVFRETEESRSFASLVLESNRGDCCWFVKDDEELSSQLHKIADQSQ